MMNNVGREITLRQSSTKLMDDVENVLSHFSLVAAENARSPTLPDSVFSHSVSPVTSTPSFSFHSITHSHNGWFCRS